MSLFDASANVSTATDDNSSDLAEHQEKEGKRSKKRARHSDEWQRNIRKRRNAEGKSYVGMKGKRRVMKEERRTGKDCKCKFKCFSKFTEGAKSEILNTFNIIGDKEKQDVYLGGQIHISPIIRKRPKSGEGPRRTCSCSYMLKAGTVEIKVCKQAFCSLHGISRKRVERIVIRIQEHVPAPKDMRGKHLNRPNRIPEDILHQVDTFIQSFPKRRSHYSRNKNENKFYLSPELICLRCTECIFKNTNQTFLMLWKMNKNLNLPMIFFAAIL